MSEILDEFKFIEKLCKHYNISIRILSSRLLAGLSLAESIELGQLKTHSDHCFDHGGNEFENGEALCEHYNIDYESLLNLLCLGFSLSNALKILTLKS